MKITILSQMEKDQIMHSIKTREFFKTERLFESFEPFIISCYYKNVKNRDRLSREDFTAECYLIILTCVNRFRGNTFGELSIYITKTIKERSKTIGEMHDKHWKHNILGEYEDNSLRIIEPHMGYFEDMILSLLTLKSHCGKYAQNKLSQYDIEILKTYIYDGDLRELAARRGIKYESVMKALERALNKIRKIAISLGITSSNDDYIIV